jgi:hypothetical protein
LTIGARHGEIVSEVAPETVGLKRDDRPGVFREITRANGGLVQQAGVGAGPRDEFAERAILAVVVKASPALDTEWSSSNVTDRREGLCKDDIEKVSFISGGFVD